jgi:hypothetical protein
VAVKVHLKYEEELKQDAELKKIYHIRTGTTCNKICHTGFH